jgi:hypothetical protein
LVKSPATSSPEGHRGSYECRGYPSRIDHDRGVVSRHAKEHDVRSHNMIQIEHHIGRSHVAAGGPISCECPAKDSQLLTLKWEVSHRQHQRGQRLTAGSDGCNQLHMTHILFFVKYWSCSAAFEGNKLSGLALHSPHGQSCLVHAHDLIGRDARGQNISEFRKIRKHRTASYRVAKSNTP